MTDKNPMYSCKVMELFDNPKNVGTMDENDPDVGLGKVGSIACGDLFYLYLRIDKETQKIVDAKFKCYGCCVAISSASLMTEWIIGKTIDEALKIKNTEVAKYLDLPIIKLHCSLMVEDSVAAAIKNWQAK